MADAKTADPKVLHNGIFVAGHPRSGTSLACQLLISAGVTFPSDFGGDEYNRAGYFELQDGKELEKALLDKAMDDETIPPLNRIVDRLNNTAGLAGLKIVHIPALFFYRHVCKNMRAVFVFRHPADTKASMLRRGIAQFRLDWFTNNNALIAAAENIPKSIVVSYETLLNAKPNVAKAFQRIGFKVDLSVIHASERTQDKSGIVLSDDEIRLYNHLKKIEKSYLG